ncbi:MAG: NUDIX hydrolase [Acidimicrobiia bacterium]|nr:NUDIX hydrolase [Acidimicrobiia bacterium]
MTEVVPRDAATVCVRRPSESGFEVLMVQRTRAADFMGGDWVFPGGAVDEIDRDEAPMSGLPDELAGAGAAALRELAEEAGVWLTDPPVDAALAAEWQPLRDLPLYDAVRSTGRRLTGEALAFFAHWVTPAGQPIRFDARFFVCEAPAGTDAVADENEVHDATWISPADALGRDDSGEWAIPFPTLRTLEVLARFESTTAVMEHVRSLEEVERIVPRIVTDSEGRIGILLPGDPGYDS